MEKRVHLTSTPVSGGGKAWRSADAAPSVPAPHSDETDPVWISMRFKIVSGRHQLFTGTNDTESC